MYLSQVQVNEAREVRINLYSLDGSHILEIRTIETAYTYRVIPSEKSTTYEVVHAVWSNVSAMLPFNYATNEELEKHVFDSILETGNGNPHYKLERLSSRPIVAPLLGEYVPKRKSRKK